MSIHAQQWDHFLRNASTDFRYMLWNLLRSRAPITNLRFLLPSSVSYCVWHISSKDIILCCYCDIDCLNVFCVANFKFCGRCLVDVRTTHLCGSVVIWIVNDLMYMYGVHSGERCPWDHFLRNVSVNNRTYVAELVYAGKESRFAN